MRAAFDVCRYQDTQIRSAATIDRPADRSLLCDHRWLPDDVEPVDQWLTDGTQQ
jgi:hypothetical protein